MSVEIAMRLIQVILIALRLQLSTAILHIRLELLNKEYGSSAK